MEKKRDRFRQGWYEWLASNNRGWRLLLGLFSLFWLALFLHFREVRVDALELNATAGRYIVAQVDFEFPDYETTIVLKQQAMQDIGAIYHLDENEIRKARYALEEDLIHNKRWREAAPSSTFEAMYKAADELETILIEARFTDPRTIQKIKELQLPESSYYEFVRHGQASSFYLPSATWDRIALQIAQTDAFHKETISYVIGAFENREWTLDEDSPLERLLRNQVARTIPERLTKVHAGTRIIDQGERVTSRHLTMVQAMKQAISESRRVWDPLTIISSFLLSAIFVVITTLYFRISQPAFIRSLQQLSLFVCIVFLTLLFAKGTEYLLLMSASGIIEGVRYPIVAPFATILTCILLSPRIALFAATFLSIILSVSLAVDHGKFLILNLITSMVVIITTGSMMKRKEIFIVCLKSFASSTVVLYAYNLGENHIVSYSFLFDVGASFAFFMLTAIIVVGILPALETFFGVLTDMSLLEYMDPSSELLRRFAQEVPGTYQHSIVLGNLAETCAQAIGANGLFCRAATLYHDIGKMNNPQFYTENQQGAVNIHQLLTPLESAQVIISHVADGEAIARKYRLPSSFIDIIREHHGTTLVYYFYRKQLELKGGRKDEVDETQFRYPGPKPHTKESALIMICDTIEAASRSIEDAGEQSLTEMVDRLVGEKADDGQFDNCSLTFEELSRVKKTLVKMLLLSHHIRIKYPKKDK